MRGWFRRTANPSPAKPLPRIAPDLRLYAVGDIHGRADLLRRLHALIREDAEAASETRRRVVYLGDYVDRGPEARAVLDLLIDEPLGGFERVHLKGNHEDALLGFLEDAAIGPMWLGFGGAATLLSYGVPAPAMPARDELLHMQEAFAAAFPDDHRAFLKGLATRHEEGDFLFVHAGVRPGVPLADQREEDLLWIREPFLSTAADFGKVVVHGHSIAYEPELRHNRIGIDTGAFATGRLTCLVLAGDALSLLQA
jgi:calcineurin-like phosphoesterase family protein